MRVEAILVNNLLGNERGWTYMTIIHDDDVLNTISERIIGCAFKVSNRLGVGFVEKVYENALVHDLRKVGLDVKQQ